MYKLIWDTNVYKFSLLAIMCSDLPIPTNGLVMYSPDTTSPYSYLTMASYSCTAGYGLSGGDNTRQCVYSISTPGMWNGTAPICDGKYVTYISHMTWASLVVYSHFRIWFSISCNCPKHALHAPNLFVMA